MIISRVQFILLKLWLIFPELHLLYFHSFQKGLGEQLLCAWIRFTSETFWFGGLNFIDSKLENNISYLILQDPSPDSYCCCLITESCLTLYNLVDYSPPGSFAHGISQARILEWIVISFARESSWLRDWTHISCIGRQILWPLGHQGSPQLTD